MFCNEALKPHVLHEALSGSLIQNSKNIFMRPQLKSLNVFFTERDQCEQEHNGYVLLKLGNPSEKNELGNPQKESKPLNVKLMPHFLKTFYPPNLTSQGLLV